MSSPQKAPPASILGFDIGGANTKVVRADVQGDALTVGAYASKYYPFWQKSKEDLPNMLAEIAADVGYTSQIPICASITAELSDAYESKREGILHVVSALQATFPSEQIAIFIISGTFANPEDIARDPLPAAAANWVATAQWVANKYPDCILVDIGSTTTDIIPITSGQVATLGRTDLTRLLNRELVYTGVLRATIPSIAPSVPFRGQMCPISFERFATMADVHLILGHIIENQYTTETADGRLPTLDFSYKRLARIVCADFEEVTQEDVEGFAQYLFQRQVSLIAESLEVISQRSPPHLPFILTGLGAKCLGLPACTIVDEERPRVLLSQDLGGGVDILSSAFAVAWCYWKYVNAED